VDAQNATRNTFFFAIPAALRFNSRMVLHVHLLETFEPPVLEALRAQLSSDIRLTTGAEVAPDAHLLVAGWVERAHLTASSQLRAILVPYTGIAPGLRAALLEFPHLALHNSRWPTIPTAEGALTLLLAATKFVLPADRAFREHNWEIRYRPSPSILLHGKTALVLGFGAIGKLVGQMCHALGMRVIGVKRTSNPTNIPYPAEVFPITELKSVLPRASVLICTLPLTAETKGLIGATELSLLTKPAFLVNVGRGPVIDEAALYAALKDGTLAAAGLDVWYTYPKDASEHAHTPPSQYPFHELENVVLSPHRIDLVREHDERLVDELAQTLNAAARGEPLPNRMDVKAGY
jgi:phosphoglycerate dehydrogenase-like enzyme